MNKQAELRQDLIGLYLHVCQLDVQSLKPGNISVYSGGKDLSVDDFLSSAKASAEPITDPRSFLRAANIECSFSNTECSGYQYQPWYGLAHGTAYSSQAGNA